MVTAISTRGWDAIWRVNPTGLTGGINTYAYVGENPVTGTDPLGLFDPLNPAYDMLSFLGETAEISHEGGVATFFVGVAWVGGSLIGMGINGTITYGLTSYYHYPTNLGTWI